MSTLLQMITPSPFSILLWPTLLLSWTNSQKLIKLCNPTWIPSCRNSNQSSTKWTTVMHMQQQCKIDIVPPSSIHTAYNIHQNTSSPPQAQSLFPTAHQLEQDLQCSITLPFNRCHHLLDFMDATPPMKSMVLEWHRLEKNVVMVMELGIKSMDETVEPKSFECDTIIPLPNSTYSTTGSIASAMNMTYIMTDINAHGICAYLIIIHS